MRLIDFFFALRPLVLVPAWSFFILGYGLGWDPDHSAPFPWLRFLAMSLILAGVHLVNQIADFEADRLNGKGFFLQRGIFSRRLYAAVAGVCGVLGLGIAWARSESPVLLAATAALGLTYSIPPLRLSARPGFDLLANACGYGALALLLGAGNMASFAAPWVFRVACCVLAVGAVFLHTTLLDLEGDRRTGKMTSGLALGAARTRRVAALLALAGAAAATRTNGQVLMCASTALVLLTAAAAAWPDRVSSRTVCVAGTGLFALAAGVCVPLFPAGVALLVVITRLFYKRRFALAYPAL